MIFTFRFRMLDAGALLLDDCVEQGGYLQVPCEQDCAYFTAAKGSSTYF
jgi:hypothetical protein